MSTLDKIAKATDQVFPSSVLWMLRDFYPQMACFEKVKWPKMEIKLRKMTLDLKAGFYLVLVLLLCDAHGVASPNLKCLSHLRLNWGLKKKLACALYYVEKWSHRVQGNSWEAYCIAAF